MRGYGDAAAVLVSTLRLRYGPWKRVLVKKAGEDRPKLYTYERQLRSSADSCTPRPDAVIEKDQIKLGVKVMTHRNWLQSAHIWRKRCKIIQIVMMPARTSDIVRLDISCRKFKAKGGIA